MCGYIISTVHQPWQKEQVVHKTRLSSYFKTEHKNLMLIYLKGI